MQCGLCLDPSLWQSHPHQGTQPSPHQSWVLGGGLGEVAHRLVLSQSSGRHSSRLVLASAPVGNLAYAVLVLGWMLECCGVSHPSDSGGEGAGKDEGLDALLQPWNVHDLQEVALHSAQQSRVRDPFVLGMGPLHNRQQS